MSLRRAVLFEGDKASLILRLQCAQKGALQPIMASARMLEKDRSATPYMRAWWEKAFPDRERLPFGPIANADGTGTDKFWDVLG
jgi:hypothetical protein